MVLEGLVLSIYESLTVKICKITPIMADAEGWRKDQQDSLCRSFSGCNHARVIINEMVHVISSQVTCFFFWPRFEKSMAIL